MAYGKGHGDHRKTEGEGHSQEADADLRKSGGEHGATAAAEDQPKGSDEFGSELAEERHSFLSLGSCCCQGHPYQGAGDKNTRIARLS
jgi:hypothetical protein